MGAANGQGARQIDVDALRYDPPEVRATTQRVKGPFLKAVPWGWVETMASAPRA